MQQLSSFLHSLHTNEHITGNWNNFPIQVVRVRMRIGKGQHACAFAKEKILLYNNFFNGLNRLVLFLWRLTTPTPLPLFFYLITVFDSRIIEEYKVKLLPGVTVL